MIIHRSGAELLQMWRDHVIEEVILQQIKRSAEDVYREAENAHDAVVRAAAERRGATTQERQQQHNDNDIAADYLRSIHSMRSECFIVK